jgi:hypothetical protein
MMNDALREGTRNGNVIAVHFMVVLVPNAKAPVPAGAFANLLV